MPGETATVTVKAAPNHYSTYWPVDVAAVDTNGEVYFAEPNVDIDGPAPTVTSVSTHEGPTAGGTEVAIVGAHFSDVAVVTFDGSPVIPDSIDANADFSQITGLHVTAPGHAAGHVEVKVVNYDGKEVVVPGGFTYAKGAGPTLASAGVIGNSFGLPTKGASVAGGEMLVLDGKNIGFAYAPDFSVALPTVTVGSRAVSAIFGSGTQLFLTTPGVAFPGPVDVTLTNPDGQTATLRHAFTYYPEGVAPAPAPIIDSVGGGSAPDGQRDAGDYATIYGNGFDPSATVLVGGQPAQVGTHSPAFLGVFLPAYRAGAKKVDVVVKNSDGQSVTLAGGYTYP